MDIKNILSLKMKAARVLKGLTQIKAAELIGIDLTYYAKIETGKVFPSFKVLTKIVDVLDFTIDDIVKPSDKSTTYQLLTDLINKFNEDELELILAISQTLYKINNKNNQ